MRTVEPPVGTFLRQGSFGVEGIVPERSRRIHERQRMKAKAARFYPGQNPGLLADNLRPCSCLMCSYEKVFAKPRIKRVDPEAA